MILALRTDAPEVEYALLDKDGREIVREKWLAERRLAQELLGRLQALLADQQHTFSDLEGLIGFRGPGSFTGLRIGLTVLNTVAYAESVPVVGTMGEDWVRQGIERLVRGEDDRVVLPEYGAEARITKPKK